MKKLKNLLCFLTLTLLIPCCRKEDSRNIIIGMDYGVVAAEDVSNNKTSVITILFQHAPGVRFTLGKDKLGRIWNDEQSYVFTWMYAVSDFEQIEIRFQDFDNYTLEQADVLRKMEGFYATKLTNGSYNSPHHGIKMNNGVMELRIVARR